MRCNPLRGMRHTTGEDPVILGVNGAQLYVGLQKKALAGEGDLEYVRELLGVSSDNPRAQDYLIGAYGYRPSQSAVLNGNLNPSLNILDNRILTIPVPQEVNSQLPGRSVEILGESVGPNIPVEYEDIHVGIESLYGDGVFYGLLTADTAAIGIGVVSRPYALDHRHALPFPDLLAVP